MKYSYEGNPELFVTFDLPFKTPKVDLDESKENIKVSGEKKDSLSSGTATDQDGNFYLVSVTRPMKKKRDFS